MRAALVASAIVGLTGCVTTASRPTTTTLASVATAEEDVDALDDEQRSEGLIDAGDDLNEHLRLDDRDNEHSQLDARLGSAPHVADVLAAAYAAAGLGGRLPGHVALRARLGGLVPWVSIRTGRDTSWHDEDPDVGRGTTLEVRATWRLDRLVFDGRELQVVALEAARRRERRRLATHVIRTYFAWKRSGSRSRSDEAAAELDALTAGWFSEAVQRSASEVRTAPPSVATP